MDSSAFNALDYTKQTEAVLQGTLLADRLCEHAYIKLYNLENFYIEVFFDHKTQLITKFRAFEHTMFVMPYLVELKIAV